MDELPTRRYSDAAMPVPVLVRPVVTLRSPVLDPRPIQTIPVESLDDRPGMGFPSSDVLSRAFSTGTLVAIPALAVFGWQLALMIAIVAAAMRELDGGLDEAARGFGDGFLPYRPDDGWPRGVQEDDDVRWSWAPTTFTRASMRQGAAG
jgi:hypothetical protein